MKDLGYYINLQHFLTFVNYPIRLLSHKTAVIVGIDEAGRGALAGPVVAGACVLDDALEYPEFIKDSKKLTESQREEAFGWIAAHCIYGIGQSSASIIDSEGILAATERAMQDAVRMITDVVTPTYLLVDGKDKFWFDYPHSSVIRGDETEQCISAGSIVAKVTRDRLMKEAAIQFPIFGFEEHKGYGSPAHIEALRKEGVCVLHRQTFLKNIITPSSALFATRSLPQ